MKSSKLKEQRMKMGKGALHGAVILLAIFVLIFGLSVPSAIAGSGDEFDEAKLYFELNDTDGDLGIHALIDGDAWEYLEIEDPRGNEMLNIFVEGRLQNQGLTEIFFESAEPAFDELPPEDFFNRFPQGKYEIGGITLEGEELESKVFLSQVMPAPPENILVDGMPAAEDCDAVDLPPVKVGDVIISWDAVTASHPGIGRKGHVKVDGYQVVVEREEPALLVFSVDLPGDVTSVVIPEGFIALGEGDELKFEILVRAASGNQTAVESCFEVLEY